MFHLLHRVSTEQAISGTYYAIRLIRHRREIADIQKGLRVEGLETEPSSMDQAFALEIMESIQETEQSPLEGLDDPTAEEYIAQLAKMVQERALIDFGFDPVRAQELLEYFREPPAVAVGGTTGW